MGRPTLVSLAKELGVSRQTVSNVINAPHLVKAETRERVQKAIEDSGYQPNRAAQSLRYQRSNTLAMRIYPSSDGIYGAAMDRFHHRLVSCAHQVGYNIMPITANDDADELAQLISLHERGSIDGCLLSGTDLGDLRPAGLRKRRVPMVSFGRPWGQDDANHFWVDVDGAAATEEATRHFLAAGHQRIGFVGMVAGSGPGDDRRAGWRRAMATVVDEATITSLDTAGRDQVESGRAATTRLVGQGATAFVCASDSLAFGALLAARDLPRTQEGDVAVIGYDDTPVARALGMSSITQPTDEAVELLVSALVEQVECPEAEARQPVLLPAQLQIRTLSVSGI
ncbi:LacI family DNA-binding transcriptional regulator [Luteococcus sp. Sow4_B9]|uniref:LacI family DNA-binding transcriptional regulator n=1 Tax=Luteococcus sp. Sow4_B9 TaxID=3438792 RepID=UPI003F9A2754